ncbi:hypothetical protein HY772_06405, partial [Candidatus Woesearchaeota archaeon]|nr:hypothetical protein [Candidatus Woesearchaeota archaeon]
MSLLFAVSVLSDQGRGDSIKTRLHFAGIAIAIAGCARPMIGVAGRDFGDNPAQEIVVGQTPKADIIGLLGVPYTTKRTTLGDAVY